MRTVKKLIKLKECDILLLNKESNDTIKSTFVLPNELKTEKQILKALSQNENIEKGYKPIAVLSCKEVKHRYEMPVEYFINHSTQIF